MCKAVLLEAYKLFFMFEYLFNAWYKKIPFFFLFFFLLQSPKSHHGFAKLMLMEFCTCDLEISYIVTESQQY